MDEKAFLLQEIRYSKRKQNVKKFLRYESAGIAAGGTIAIVLEGLSVFVPFYTVHVCAVLAILCGVAAGGIYTVKKRCTMAQAAQQIDRFGFQERILTAYERIGKEGDFDRMQRSDAVHMLQENRAWQKVRVCPDRRKLAALGLSLGLALVLSFVPSPAREQAQQRHAIRQEAREKEKEIQDVMDALKQTDTSSMTKEQKKALQELIQSLALSQKEMQQADTKQSLASAEQKLSYKYEQAAQTSGADVLASALKNVQANANAGNQLAKCSNGFLFVRAVSHQRDGRSLYDTERQHAKQAFCVDTALVLFKPDTAFELVRLLNEKCGGSCMQTDFIVDRNILCIHRYNSLSLFPILRTVTYIIPKSSIRQCSFSKFSQVPV